MIDAAILKPLESFAERMCSLSDVDAASALLVAQGLTPIRAGGELSRICSPGGEADRLAATLEDPYAAAQFVRKIASAFAPFAEVLLAVEVTGDGETWARTPSGYKKTPAAEAGKAKREAVISPSTEAGQLAEAHSQGLQK